MVRSLLDRSSPFIATLGLLAVWELGVRGLGVPDFVLPSPSRTIQSLIANAHPIATHTLATLEATVVGLAASVTFGLALGLLSGYSETIRRALYPLLVAFNTIPKVAIVPVLVIWFGIGKVPAVLTAFLISFFPIFVNVSTSLATVEPELRDMLATLGATRTQFLLKVGIPRSMPDFFGSLKVASTLAFVGAIISETVASNEGIGYLMIAASSKFDVPLVFAGLLVVSALSVLLYAAFVLLERRVAGWAFRSAP